MSKPLKILYTIPNFDTAGSGKALLNIARRLDKTRFEPNICCSHDQGKLFREVISSGILVHLRTTTLDMIPRVNGMLACNKLSRYFITLNIDLIHSFHYGPDYSEPLAARLAGIPWIYTKKNMNWGGKSKNSWKLRTLLASHILVQNKDMIKEFFPGKKNVSLVPRGVDTEEYSPRPKEKKLLEKHRIRKDEKVILAVANLVPVKGIEILLDAFELLSKKHNSIRLFIVGDKENDYGRKMEAKTIQSPCSARIHFTGKVQNVSDYYSISDVFVLPTLNEGRREGCPVSLLEAMASGLLVLASDIPGVIDILAPFPESMFPAGDVVKLSEALAVALTKPSNEQANLIRSRIIKNYNIGIEVSHHQSVYQRCLTL